MVVMGFDGWAVTGMNVHATVLCGREEKNAM